MQHKISLLSAFVSLLLLTSCSSLNVVGSWSKSENLLNNKNVLVITKTTDKLIRIDSENQIREQFSEQNVTATASYEKFPAIIPNKKQTQDQIDLIVKTIKSEGFNAVVLTTLKDYDETTYTSQSGGYYAGGSYYDPFYGGFSSYYGNVYSYYDQGMYVPEETTTQTSKKYTLETVTYDLDLPKEKQLISVVSVEIEDPSNLQRITKKYAEKVVSKILNK